MPAKKAPKKRVTRTAKQEETPPNPIFEAISRYGTFAGVGLIAYLQTMFPSREEFIELERKLTMKKKKDIRAVYLAQRNVLSSVLSTKNNQTISVMLIARTKRNHFSKLLILFTLFPLNRAGWFGCYIIDDAVNTAHFIDDTGRDATKKLMTERVIISRHAIG